MRIVRYLVVIIGITISTEMVDYYAQNHHFLLKFGAVLLAYFTGMAWLELYLKYDKD